MTTPTTFKRTDARKLAVASVVFLALLGCKLVRQLTGGGEAKCADYAACQKDCGENDAKACIKLGDLHRREPHGVAGKWDPEAAKTAYMKACDAGNQLGCAKHASMDAHRSAKSYERAKRACDEGIELGCAVSGSILVAGREYDDGKVDKDEATGRSRLEGQCKKGMPACCAALGYNYYWSSTNGDRDKAEPLFRKACDGGALTGCFYLGAFVEKDDSAKLKLLAKVCDEGLAGGDVSADNSCRVEAEQHLKWLTSKLLTTYVEMGKPEPGSSGAREFREKLKADAAYQERKSRMLEITRHACNMGSSDACKLVDDNPKWFNEGSEYAK